MIRLLAFLALFLPALAFAATPVASVTASVTSGFTPLLVFFDATASTDADTSKPKHHLTHCFDAGDGTSDTYDLTTHSTPQKSKHCGAPLWAYVYEEVGTHTFEYTVHGIDGSGVPDGQTDTQTISITVNEYADADTTCVSTSGTFTGDDRGPSGSIDRCLGATHITGSDFDAEIENAKTAGDERVLFREGETFDASTFGDIDVVGMHVGSFGPDGGSNQFIVDGSSNAIVSMQADDTRATDFEWTGSVATDAGVGATNSSTDDADHVLWKNIKIVGPIRRFLTADALDEVSGSPIPKYWGIFGVDVPNCGNSSTSACIFASVEYFAIVDTKFTMIVDGDIAEHNIRFQHAEDTFVHNVQLQGALSGKHLLAVRAFDWTGLIGGHSNRWSENNFVSDSRFIGNTNWPIQSQGRGASNHIVKSRDFILDGNYFTAVDTDVLTFALLSTNDVTDEFHDVTARNNLVDTTGITAFGGQAFIGSPDSGLEVYNNSLYGGDGNSSGFLSGASGDCIVKNNLSWDTSGSQDTLKDGGSCSGTVSGNADADGGETGVANLTDCPFLTCPPTTPAHFATDGDEEQVDAGVDVPHVCAYGQFDRDQGTMPDIGAHEKGPDADNCVPVPAGGGGPEPVSSSILMAI